MVVLEKYLLHIKRRLKKSESNSFKNLQSPFLLNPIFKRFFWSNLPSLDPLFYKWGSEFYLLHSEGGSLIYYKKEWKYCLGVGNFERVEETDTFLWLISSRLSSLYLFYHYTCAKCLKINLFFSFSSTPPPHHFYWE